MDIFRGGYVMLFHFILFWLRQCVNNGKSWTGFTSDRSVNRNMIFFLLYIAHNIQSSFSECPKFNYKMFKSHLRNVQISFAKCSNLCAKIWDKSERNKLFSAYFGCLSKFKANSITGCSVCCTHYWISSWIQNAWPSIPTFPSPFHKNLPWIHWKYPMCGLGKKRKLLNLFSTQISRIPQIQ